MDPLINREESHQPLKEIHPLHHHQLGDEEGTCTHNNFVNEKVIKLWRPKQKQEKEINSLKIMMLGDPSLAWNHNQKFDPKVGLGMKTLTSSLYI